MRHAGRYLSMGNTNRVGGFWGGKIVASVSFDPTAVNGGFPVRIFTTPASPCRGLLLARNGPVLSARIVRSLGCDARMQRNPRRTVLYLKRGTSGFPRFALPYAKRVRQFRHAFYDGKVNSLLEEVRFAPRSSLAVTVQPARFPLAIRVNSSWINSCNVSFRESTR